MYKATIKGDIREIENHKWELSFEVTHNLDSEVPELPSKTFNTKEEAKAFVDDMLEKFKEENKEFLASNSD